MTDEAKQCDCRQCIRDRGETRVFPFIGEIPREYGEMILCPQCGNKRCPPRLQSPQRMHEQQRTGATRQRLLRYP